MPVLNKTFVVGDKWIYLSSYHGEHILEISLNPPFVKKMLVEMPDQLAYFGAELFDDKIVKVGGMNFQEVAKDNVSMYDIGTNEYKECHPLPYAVYDMATVKWTDSIIVLGGLSDHDEPLNKVSMYNVKTQESQMLPPMLTKRVGCGAVAMDGSTIIVVGGKNGANEILNSVESFNFNTYSWKELPNMHEARYLPACIGCELTM